MHSQKRTSERKDVGMEDADFVADSEDELHSEEDLAVRAVVDLRAVSAAARAPADHYEDDDDSRQLAQDRQRHEYMQDGDGDMLAGEHLPLEVVQIDDSSIDQEQQSENKSERGRVDSSGVASGDGGEQGVGRQEQLLLHEPTAPTNQVEPTPIQMPASKDFSGSSSELVRASGSGEDTRVHNDADAESSDRGVRVFKVGDLIEVESRTWPGINKPGGSGRVVNVHQETDAAGEVAIFYDVRYVLGGFERRIESDYVELSHILQLERAQGRVRFERVFYHDEFADLHKKKRVPYEHDAFESNRQDAGQQPSSASGTREPAKRKRPSSGRRRSSDSDGAQRHQHQQQRSESRQQPVSSESESGDGNEGQVIRRIGDNTFVLDVSSMPDGSEVRYAGRESKRTEHSSGQQRNQDENDKRRRRRIIESDDDSSDIEYQQPQDPQQFHQQQQSHHHRHVERTRVRSPKKRRRYVGGYLHSGDDVDATFIQPEDNANALPDDVAREIGFKLGKTKVELKTQLATIASLLTANLRKFKDQKDLISQKIKCASALSTEELRDFYRQTIELEHFLTQSLIRGGEDVINAVIVKLTRKGGNLSDSVELVFDDQKREISDLGVWIRKVLSSLETAFKIRGESLPSEDRHLQQQQQQQQQQRRRDNDGEPVSASSESDDHHRYQSGDDDFDSNSFQYEDGDDYYDSRDMGVSIGTGTTVSRNPRQASSYENGARRGTTSLKPPSSRGSSKKSQAIDRFMASFDGRRVGDTQDRRQQRKHSSKPKYASSLDDFDFIQYSSEHQRDAFWADEPRRQPGQATIAAHEMFRSSNFRFPSKKRPMAPSDPRWNWLKIGSLKSQSEANALAKRSQEGPGGVMTASSTSSSHAIHRRSHKKKYQEKLIGHVQSVRLQLRDKRLQGTRSNSYSSGGVRGFAPSFVSGYRYDPPSAMAMASRKESSSFSRYQQQYPRTSASSMRSSSTISSFEYSAGSAPAKSAFFKDSRIPGQSPSSGISPSSGLSSTTSAGGPQIKWESVFDVLSETLDDEDLPGLHSERRRFLMTCGLLECCCGLHASPTTVDSLISDAGDDGDDATINQETIKGIATRLRQCFSDLRFQEFEFMSSLSGGNATAESENCELSNYSSSPEWRALVEAADRYHASLAFLVLHAVQSVQNQLELESGKTMGVQLTKLARAIVLEVSRIVAQLPDCKSLFGSCPSYVFFFEVEDRSAKTTPLLTAITRTYWYSIQLLIDLKTTPTAAAGTATSRVQTIESVIESILPTNRAILAASLFLVDLYLYLPSSYRLEQSEPSEKEQGALSVDISLPQEPKVTLADTPAISLWLLLYDCFASEKCSFQAGKLSASGDGRDFWAFLQTMYRDHFIDNLAIAFIQERSSGGYLVDSIPKISKAPNQAEDLAEGQLLALQSVWDLCVLFSLIFPTGDSKERDDLISEARWAVVKDLLQPGKHAYLPFSSTLTLQNQSSKEFAVYSRICPFSAGVFKLHVLQKVVVLSKFSTPQSDIVERLLEELWEDTPNSSNQADERELVELSPFWADLLLNTVGKSGNQLSDFVNARKWDTADHVDMVSGIILVQILKFEKAIHRNRFRQPICRVISTRFDATKPNEEGVKAPVVAPPQPTTKSVPVKSKIWNWGGSGPATDSKKVVKVKEKAKVQQPTAAKRGRDEERLMVSILLSLAVSSICQDTPGVSASSLRDPTQRANKSLKRDLEFYYKEMARVVNGNAEFGVLLGQALYVMGRVAMAYSNEYPIIFSYLNDQLLSSVRALRSIQRASIQTNDKDIAAATPSYEAKRQTRLLQRGVLSSLYLMRDLTQRLCEIITTIPEPSPASSCSYTMDAVRSSLSFVLNSGLEACLDAAVDELISIEALNVTLEILQCVLPRAPDEPVQCLQVLVTSAPVGVPTTAAVEPAGEFDEFDDDDLWANVDLDTIVSSGNSSSPTQQGAMSSLKTFEEPILQSILTHLRIGLQRVVVKFPQRGLVSYHELYAIELLGVMVSTCSFHFGWSLVSTSSMKPRMLAPRLFSAILKHHPEKEWFSTCFLSESGADQELANIWLMGTLDLQALFPSLCTLQTSKGDSKFAFPVLETTDEGTNVTTATTELATTTSQIRYSNYWIMLTDAIIFSILRENQVAQYKMDPLLLELLRTTATNSKFVQVLQSLKQKSAASSLTTLQPPSDLLTLYELHLDIFQEVCRSAGTMWRRLSSNQTLYRQDMNRFRLKMMDFQSGVFTTFPEAYEINLKMVCQDLDRARHNWYDLSEKFLRDFASTSPTSPLSTSRATAVTNYHSIDESLELAHGQLKDDPSVRILIVLFKFMYGCVDTFLYHCGAMAIGQQNIFFSVMKLMFRQASCVEFPQAEKRLRQLELALAPSQQFDLQQSKWFDNSSGDSKTSSTSGSTNKNGQKQQQNHKQQSSISPACLGFVESVRLFFARQKYPSLIHWFSQTLETYQTVKRGWSSSPLRKLLLNVLDPHGSLGIHSYYPIEVHHHATSALGPQREFDVRQVRREAFYLSCGLFFCRCTNSYEHSRRQTESSTVSPPGSTEYAAAHAEAKARLRTLRKFILNQFVQETLDYAAGDQVCLHETLVPVAQFLRAVLSHCNMNLQRQSQSHGDSGSNEHLQVPDFDFQVREVYYCLESILLYCVKTFPADHVLQSSISCVLVLELCIIVEEMVALNDAAYDNEVSMLLELALAYFNEIFAALGKTSSNALEPIFAMADVHSNGPSLPTTSELLATFRPISSHGIHGIKPVPLQQELNTSAAFDEYGISRLRVRADLVVSIGRLAERCRKSSDYRLRRLVEISIREPVTS